MADASYERIQARINHPHRCTQDVHKVYRFYRCERVGKVERDGKWFCTQHDPVVVQARREEADRLYKIESDRKAAEWRLKTVAPAMRDALQAIADGHNDPRSLAAEILGRLK